MTNPEKKAEKNDVNVLTSIHQAYTVGDNNEAESEEMNKLIVKYSHLPMDWLLSDKLLREQVLWR